MTALNQSIINEFREKFKYARDGNWTHLVNILDDDENIVGKAPAYLVPSEIEAFILSSLTRVREATIKEAVELSDKIEMQEPDGGTSEWMAFKAFRNTLRDRLNQPLD